MNSKLKKYAAYSTLAGMLTVGAFVGHTAKEVEKNTVAAQKVEETINSQCFETEWLSSGVDEKQLNGLNKYETLELIRGSETTIELEMYRSWANTVGYTYGGTKKIWMNRKFHDGFTVCQKAANIGHELTHKLGLTHDVKLTKRRPFSGPYITGTIISKCCL